MFPSRPETDGPVLVETLDIGVCGTDREIAAGEYGTAPAGSDVLVLGHESLGRVVEAPGPSGFVEVDCGADIVLEATGVPSLVADVMARNAHNAVVCLTGVSPRGRTLSVDMGSLNREVVLPNDVVLARSTRIGAISCWLRRPSARPTAPGWNVLSPGASRCRTRRTCWPHEQTTSRS